MRKRTSCDCSTRALTITFPSPLIWANFWREPRPWCGGGKAKERGDFLLGHCSPIPISVTFGGGGTENRAGARENSALCNPSLLRPRVESRVRVFENVS